MGSREGRCSFSVTTPHLIVLIISHWLELGHKATSSCKGGWEMKYLFWAAMYPANFFFSKVEREVVPGRQLAVTATAQDGTPSHINSMV